ncbi:MAG TPA: hypothetical protein VEL03_13275 [Streptosporangiaceae bacterium]|nr:hypothetical protein [Streptosporangiaceae bacterium]
MAGGTEAGLTAEIDEIADDLHRLLVRVRNGSSEPGTGSAELAELASKALRLASLYENAAAADTITRLRQVASQITELAAELHGQATS